MIETATEREGCEMNMTITVPNGLIEALQHQAQCDEDGTNCIVSREAVDTAIGILQAAPQLEHERDDLAAKCKWLSAESEMHKNAEMQWEKTMMDVIGEDGIKSVADAVHKVQGELEKAQDDYETAMHRVSQLEVQCEKAETALLVEQARRAELEALPLLQFTSVDDELPEKPDVYLCKFADGDIQSFPFTDPGGFATENYSPEMKVVAWCDPNSLPSAADGLARAQAVAVADALDGFSVDYWIMAKRDNPECPGNTASACVADDAERRAKAARDSAIKLGGPQ